MSALPKIVWISWERHRRTRSIADAMNIQLFEFCSRQGRWLRHPRFLLRTIWTLLRERPDVLVVQNPSLVLTLLAICLRPLLRYRLAVDAHNAGIYPCEVSHRKYRALYPLLHRQADLTIVTNSALADIVARNGGLPLVLIDPLPVFPRVVGTSTRTGVSPARVTFICTFAGDEPVEEVFRAAAQLLGEIELRVTGNVSAHRHTFKADPPDNVIFTGFLPDDEFVSLLSDSDCIIDLTTLPDCLVCGAYEAASLRVPMVLSKSSANQQTFVPGAVLAANCAHEVANAVRDVLTRGPELRRDMELLNRNLCAKWEAQSREFADWLSGADCTLSQEAERIRESPFK